MRKLLLTSAILISAASSAFAVEVTQADQQFSQESVTLKAGDSITFTNKDTVTHNIKVLAGDDAEDKGLQKPGEVITQKFDKPGTYQVRCNIHPKMKMDVTVQ